MKRTKLPKSIVYHGVMRNGDDVRDVWVRKEGSRKYRLRIGKVRYEGLVFTKEELKQKFQWFAHGNWEVDERLVKGKF